MLKQLDLEKILFLDIETVPMVENYELLSEKFRKLWDKKAEYLKKTPDDTTDTLFSRAGIYAEFGKIVCISCGFFYNREFRLKSFYGDDELILLQEFSTMLNRFHTQRDNRLCAHNGKEFDFPFLSRRLLINGLPLPELLDSAGKRPWEIAHLDTMELWKFGDFKSYTSLELLTAVFGIPTPKDDIDGSMVAEVYYKEKNLERIAHYCQRDTLAVAQLLRRYAGLPVIDEKDIIFV
jgi:3'-5' exonuclease